MTFPAVYISISINTSKDKVYQFASNPENFPKWLAFVKSVSKKTDNIWSVESDLGKIEIELSPENEFGVIDHVVTLPNGAKVYNPLRIIENGDGSEVTFTLFKLPGKTDKEFTIDAASVKDDLQTLKNLLEK